MLAPVYQLIFRARSCSLLLTEDQITISYKTYNSDNPSDMQEIIENQLAPGEKFSRLETILFNQPQTYFSRLRFSRSPRPEFDFSRNGS